jgi:hypothetical protein
MALTFTDVVANVDLDEGLGLRVIDVLFDNSYPTGGEAITAAQLQLSSILAISIIQKTPADTNALNFGYDFTNNKIMAFRTDQVDDFQEQVPNATDLSTVTVRVLAIGVPE